jgi:hypothetical protein
LAPRKGQYVTIIDLAIVTPDKLANRSDVTERKVLEAVEFNVVALSTMLTFGYHNKPERLSSLPPLM